MTRATELLRHLLGSTVCRRCGGLMVSASYEDAELGELDMLARRCVQCGDVIDPIILKHRGQGPGLEEGADTMKRTHMMKTATILTGVLSLLLMSGQPVQAQGQKHANPAVSTGPVVGTERNVKTMERPGQTAQSQPVRPSLQDNRTRTTAPSQPAEVQKDPGLIF